MPKIRGPRWWCPIQVRYLGGGRSHSFKESPASDTPPSGSFQRSEEKRGEAGGRGRSRMVIWQAEFTYCVAFSKLKTYQIRYKKIPVPRTTFQVARTLFQELQNTRRRRARGAVLAWVGVGVRVRVELSVRIKTARRP